MKLRPFSTWRQENKELLVFLGHRLRSAFPMVPGPSYFLLDGKQPPLPVQFLFV